MTLNIKLKPGQRICIGGAIVIDVVLDSRRKLSLSVAAPQDHPIVWHDPKPTETPIPTANHNP